jgi:hypothetical protein
MPCALPQSTAGATQINWPAGRAANGHQRRTLSSGTLPTWSARGTDMRHTDVRRTRPAGHTQSPHPFTLRRAFRCTLAANSVRNLNVRRHWPPTPTCSTCLYEPGRAAGNYSSFHHRKFSGDISRGSIKRAS